MPSESELKNQAEQIRNLLREALAALEDPQVLADLVTFAQAHPMIAWEPVALANFALHSRREAAASGILPDPHKKVLLPSDPSSGGAGTGLALQPPPHLLW